MYSRSQHLKSRRSAEGMLTLGGPYGAAVHAIRPSLSQPVRAELIPSWCPELGPDFRDDEGRYQSDHDGLEANMREGTNHTDNPVILS